MKTSSIIVCFLFGTFLLGNANLLPADDSKSNPEKLPVFQLRDARGKDWTSEELVGSKATVIVFLGVECPLVKLYAQKLNRLLNDFPGVSVVGINSNRHDSITEIEAFEKETNVAFPILKDPGNKLADLLKAERTPEVFVFNSERVLAYRGAIDDQYHYGMQRDQAENFYLRDSLTAIVKNQIPKRKRTEAIGCIIGRVLKETKSLEVTYTNQVSRLLNKHCVSCHRPGEIAPFSLTDYDEVVGWAEMIQEVINDRRMPPWHANPAHGKFKNDISLSKDQISMINRWVENGAPEGKPTDLPEPPKFVEGWRIGTPDVVFKMKKTPYRVPARGVIPYKHFVVETGFKEDKWIQAAECRIGNRAVVHHIIVAVHDEGASSAHGQIESEWITATAPGAQPLELPEGYAKLIPAGSKLIFQMHYTPNGTAQTDLSSVGFKFVDASKVRKSVGTREILNRRFRIPPNASDHEVRASRTFRQDSQLLTLFPHMHLRGKAFRYTATYPDGSEEILLDIPAFDFNWQNGYMFPEPKLIPAGTKIECVAKFDNSKENFANPNPNKTVRWGDQTWDEMMIGYYDMALADQDLTKDE
ncbi:MAG: redoxin domain-containing protein [Planctomycetota bacterium]